MPLPHRCGIALLMGALLGACSERNRPTSLLASRTHDSLAVGARRTHPTGQVLSALFSSGRPFGIAVSRNGVVYCTLLDSARLVRATLGSDSLSRIPVGAVPTDIAFDPAENWAYVTNQFAQAVGVIDTRVNRQVAAIPVEGDPFRVAVGPEGQRVYATTNAGNVVQIQADTRSTGWTVPLGGNLNGLAVNSADERIYVGDVGGVVYELNAGGEVVRRLAVAGRPQGLALSSDGRELYVAGELGDLIALDLETGSEKARIRLGSGGFGIAVTPDQSQIWITAPGTGEVFVVDRASLTLIRALAVGGTPRRIAFDLTGATAVIANEAGAISMVR